MRKLIYASKFNKDLKKVKKYPEYSNKKFDEYISLLMQGKPLPANAKDHPLARHSPIEYKGFREFHLAPDIVVVYRIRDDVIELARIGKHNNLGLTESIENDAIYLYGEDDFSDDDWDALDDDIDGISDNDLAFAKELCDFLMELASVDDDIDEDYEEEQVSEEDLAFAKELEDFLLELASVDNDISEEFVNERSAKQHFYKHCIDHSKSKKSTRHNVYYDFKDVSGYKQHEQQLSDLIRYSLINTQNRPNGSDNREAFVIHDLTDRNLIDKAFRKLFEGDILVIFDISRPAISKLSSINITAHSYATNVTNNYGVGNTIDIIIRSIRGTNTLYPVDAGYFENKINNILSKYSSKPFKKFKINH